MNLSPICEKLLESQELLFRHICDLAGLFAILALTAVALAGWGRLAARWIGLPRARAINALEIWVGFAIVVGLVGLLHLVFPVDWRMSLALAVIGLAGFCAIDRPVWKLNILALVQFVKAHSWSVVLIALVLVIWGSRAMSPPTVYDSGLYHFSTIRWLNEYSIVPGLGNLHGRLAFNQSYFSFVALMNISPIWNKGYAAAGVFLLLLSAATVAEVGIHRMRGGIWIAGILLLALAVYARSLSSPTPDIAVALLQAIIFLVLAKLVLDHDNLDKSTVLYVSVLSLMCVVIVTIKLSAVMYALTNMIIAWSLFAKVLIGHRVVVVKVLVICVVIGATHILRGYVLSGVPLYPNTFAGLWDLEWAMPIEAIQSEANWIYSWARRPGFPSEQVLGNWQWLGFWIKSFPVKGWLIFGSALLLTLLNLYVTWFYRARCRDRAAYVLYIPLVTSVLFWFVTAPAWRFLGLLPELLALVSGWLFIRRLQEVGLSCLPGGLGFGRGLQGRLVIPIMLVFLELIRLKGASLSGWQEIPSNPTQIKRTASGLQVYVPIAGDQCWNAPLPCTPYFNSMLGGRWNNPKEPDLGSGFISNAKSPNRSINSIK